MNSEERLSRIEARLDAIELMLQMPAGKPVAPNRPEATTSPTVTPPVPQAPLSRPLVSGKSHQAHAYPVTNILGWAGATALVLASIYLVRLAIDAGWLTPARQIILAMLGGFVCIGTGILLRRKDMHYASLLPAAGIVILFLSIYGAHNYYHLISTTFATSGIVAVCVLSLWLNRLFLSELYALFAVVGSYTAPLFLGDTSYSIADLIIYFACWSVVFSVFSIWVQKRNVYILAMYLAFVIFDLKWHESMPDAWVEALIFQTIHFLIFVAAAAVFSIRVEPMSQETALKHAPALVLFYFVQYHILHENIPEWAPWIAVVSAAVLLVSYFIVHHVLNRELGGGRMLLSAYVALVLVHAGYIESVPDEWAPWVGLIAIPLISLYATLRQDIKAPGAPLWIAAILVFIANYLTIFAWRNLTITIPAYDLLGLCYAAELYLAYYFLRKNHELRDIGMVALYAGHVAVMAWALQVFDNRFVVSLVWGTLAVGSLFLSLQVRSKTLGQSSLMIFAASVFKALLYDIAQAAPLIRIASLLVLGASLYLGGWLYKKVGTLDPD
ncbi:MAG TPA: DUF2339 domain-containing protein [Gallionella sp.]|nr:DUF2339 domain-containing protein [Gallionella sp.]